jgi:protein tyrosine/serine phosphatase
MGVKTVVNLRSFHTDRDECVKLGLGYVPISAQAWEGEDEEVIEFLKVATDPERQPVFVHCEHGADRTGVMCAAYRVVVQGWDKGEAVREMTSNLYGFHEVWDNLVRYIHELDVAGIREAAGLPAPGR